MARSKKIVVLLTAADVFVVLGGNREVQRLTGAGYTSVCNWKSWGCFPARYYAVMTRHLKRRGYSAPASLWDQREAA